MGLRADVNAQGGEYGNEAAASLGNEAVVWLLVDPGPTSTPRAENTATFSRLRYRHRRVVRLLEDGGADVNACGIFNFGAVALDGNEMVARLLVGLGADVNAQGGFYLNAAVLDGGDRCSRGMCANFIRHAPRPLSI